jgi:hypothetical protein
MHDAAAKHKTGVMQARMSAYLLVQSLGETLDMLMGLMMVQVLAEQWV